MLTTEYGAPDAKKDERLSDQLTLSHTLGDCKPQLSSCVSIGVGTITAVTSELAFIQLLL